jgi:uncharacterized membrane protein YhaH (DUF805 family)
MGFVDAIKSGFRNRINFSGRATRSEFWFWTLFVVLYSVVLMVAFLALNLDVDKALNPFIVVCLLILVSVVPGIALTVRRLHDLGRSGWTGLVLVVPFLGQVIFVVWMCTRGTQGPNRFGGDPLEAGPSGIVAQAPAT